MSIVYGCELIETYELGKVCLACKACILKIVKIAKKRQKMWVLADSVEPRSILRALIWVRKSIGLYTMHHNNSKYQLDICT